MVEFKFILLYAMSCKRLIDNIRCMKALVVLEIKET